MVGHAHENRALGDVDVQDRVTQTVPQGVVDQLGRQEEHVSEDLVRQPSARLPHVCPCPSRSERVAR
jgi:hypothetical protein